MKRFLVKNLSGLLLLHSGLYYYSAVFDCSNRGTEILGLRKPPQEGLREQGLTIETRFLKIQDVDVLRRRGTEREPHFKSWFTLHSDLKIIITFSKLTLRVQCSKYCRRRTSRRSTWIWRRHSYQVSWNNQGSFTASLTFISIKGRNFFVKC